MKPQIPRWKVERLKLVALMGLTCYQCKKAVEDAEVYDCLDTMETGIIFKCHGETERWEISEAMLNDMGRIKKRIIPFKDRLTSVPNAWAGMRRTNKEPPPFPGTWKPEDIVVPNPTPSQAAIDEAIAEAQKALNTSRERAVLQALVGLFKEEMESGLDSTTPPEAAKPAPAFDYQCEEEKPRKLNLED